MSGASFRVERQGCGRVVMQGSEVVFGPNARKHMAEECCDRRIRAAQRKPRPCITCGDMFLSEGAHHRMCNTCRVRASDIFEGAV